MAMVAHFGCRSAVATMVREEASLVRVLVLFRLRRLRFPLLWRCGDAVGRREEVVLVAVLHVKCGGRRRAAVADALVADADLLPNGCYSGEIQLREEREEGVADSRRGEVEGFAKLKP